jgi:rod shape-determining protein MreC
MRWSWLTRTRGLAVLVGIAFLLVLFSPQIQRRPQLIIEQPLLLLESWLQRLVGNVTGWSGRVLEDYVFLWGQGEENRRLVDDVTRLQGEVTALQEQINAVARADALQPVRQELARDAIIAHVIGRDPTNWYQSLLIDRGERDNIRPDMGVVVPDGVIGRVVKVMPKSAVVLLISDRNSVLPGLAQRSRDEGLIEGIGGGQLRMKYLSNLADVQVGDLVVTSGLVGIFPKGLRIGTVTAVERTPDAISQQAVLAPAVDLSKLEEVIVLPLMKPEGS